MDGGDTLLKRKDLINASGVVGVDGGKKKATTTIFLCNETAHADLIASSVTGEK